MYSLVIMVLKDNAPVTCGIKSSLQNSSESCLLVRGTLTSMDVAQLGWGVFCLFNTALLGESFNIFYLHEHSMKIQGNIIGKLQERSVFWRN